MDCVQNEWGVPNRVDTETGEITPPLIVYQGSNEVVRVINKDKNEQRPRVKHAKMRDSRDTKRAFQKLSVEERALLSTLMQYLEWETNIVVGDGVTLGKKDVALRFSDIDKVSGMSKPTRIKTVRSLEEKKAIQYMSDGTGKRKAIVVNPLYGYKGYSPKQALRNTFDFDIDVDEDDE